MPGDEPYFRESRRLARAWIALVFVLSLPALLVVAVVFYADDGGFATGDLLVLAGVVTLTVLPLSGLWTVRLTTEVRADGLSVRLFPVQWSFRTVPADAIESVARTGGSPARQFGGVGIRQTPRLSRRGLDFDGPRAYLVGGDEAGIRIVRRDDPPLVIGTGRPADLRDALELIRR